MCCFFFHYVLAKFHFCPSSGDLPRPRIGMLSLVTVSPVITAFHSCCLSHHVFDQVNLWPAWVGFETAIFWQCSPGTVETQRLYPLRHGPWKKKLILRLRNLISKWFQLLQSVTHSLSSIGQHWFSFLFWHSSLWNWGLLHFNLTWWERQL